MAVCRSRQNALSLSTFLLFAFMPRASPVNVMPLIEIKPAEIKVLNINDVVNNLHIACGTPTPPNDLIKIIEKLEIYRILFETPPGSTRKQPMVTALNAGDRQAKSAVGESDYTADGEVPYSTNRAKIGITIKKASCKDSGEYTCEMVYFEEADKRNSSRNIVRSTELLLTDPLPIRLTVTPDFTQTKVQLGDKVNITCVAQVGSSWPATFKTKWQWSTQDTTTFTKQWVIYKGDNILDGPTEGKGCNETRSSTLKLTLKEFDSAKNFRCMIIREYKSTGVKTFPDSADFATIPNFLEKRKFLGKAAVIGIIFGILAILCGLGLSIFWYNRRRNKKKAALEEAEKMKTDIDERRKSLAIVIGKRKSLGGAHAKDYDAMLGKLKETEPKLTEKEKPQIEVEEVSDVESSMASSEAEESSVASNVDEVTESTTEKK